MLPPFQKTYLYHSNLEPGGWLELQEYGLPVRSADGTHLGTNILKWGELLCEAGRKTGRLMGSDICDQYETLMREAGFDVLPGTHPIRPVMFPGDDGARQATQIADRVLEAGVYVIAFSFPVVPRGKARIRVQLSASHSEQDVRECVQAFIDARDAVA